MQRHIAMVGFCSCKTDIHAIPGNILGTKAQASKPTFQGRCGRKDCRAAFGCRLRTQEIWAL